MTINNQSNSRYKNKNKNVYKDLKINSNNTLVVSIKPPDLHKKEKKIWIINWKNYLNSFSIYLLYKKCKNFFL